MLLMNSRKRVDSLIGRARRRGWGQPSFYLLSASQWWLAVFDSRKHEGRDEREATFATEADALAAIVRSNH